MFFLYSIIIFWLLIFAVIDSTQRLMLNCNRFSFWTLAFWDYCEHERWDFIFPYVSRFDRRIIPQSIKTSQDDGIEIIHRNRSWFFTIFRSSFNRQVDLWPVCKSNYRKFIGSQCTISRTGEKGECRRISDCAPIFQLYKDNLIRQNRPTVCSSVDKTVCCPVASPVEVSGSSGKRISEKSENILITQY